MQTRRKAQLAARSPLMRFFLNLPQENEMDNIMDIDKLFGTECEPCPATRIAKAEQIAHNRNMRLKAHRIATLDQEFTGYMTDLADVLGSKKAMKTHMHQVAEEFDRR